MKMKMNYCVFGLVALLSTTGNIRTCTISNGWAHHARRPFADRVYFVNQDNWALPAFEASLLEAQTHAAEIDASL